MSEFKGTRGKWEYRHSLSKNSFKVLGTVVEGRFEISRCDYIINDKLSDVINTREKIEQQANALLISKAPEMLQMIEELIHQFEYNNNSSQEVDLLNEAKQLIKQATDL